MVKNLRVAVIAIGFVNREMPNTKTQSQSYGTLLWFVQGHLLYPDQNKFFIQGSVKRANVNDQLQGLCCHKHHCNNSNDLHNIIIIIIITKLLTGQRITRYSLAGRWLRSWGSQLVNLGGRTTALLGRPPGTIRNIEVFIKKRIYITTTVNALALNPQTANGLSSQLCE